MFNVGLRRGPVKGRLPSVSISCLSKSEKGPRHNFGREPASETSLGDQRIEMSSFCAYADCPLSLEIRWDLIHRNDFSAVNPFFGNWILKVIRNWTGRKKISLLCKNNIFLEILTGWRPENRVRGASILPRSNRAGWWLCRESYSRKSENRDGTKSYENDGRRNRETGVGRNLGERFEWLRSWSLPLCIP